MPSSGGEKLCPICDSPLQPGSKKCNFCGTDLSIFDIEVEAPKKVPVAPVTPPPRASFESRVDEVMARPAPAPAPPPKAPEVKPAPAQPPVREEPKPQAKAPAPAPEPPREPPIAAPRPLAAAPAPPQEETFECPQCHAQIPVSATACPKCGVMFAEEGGDMFQCPACNTLVNIDATQCPGCGAVFVESEAEASAPAAPQAPVAPEVEEETVVPIEEVKPQPRQAPASAEPKEDQKKDKKSLGGWFKWGKKEPEPEAKTPAKEEKPAPKPAFAETRIPAHSPAKPAQEVKVLRDVSHEPARQAPATSPAQRAPAQEVRPVPVVQPAAVPQHVQVVGHDKGRDLARMVAEMKPLLALAREKDIDIGESKQLIDDAAEAGKERQLDKALELVQRSKTALMQKVDAQLGTLITKLNEEIKVARDFGGDISRATAYIQEVSKARSSGDVEAAYVYADKVGKELLPITGRYNESKRKLGGLKQLIADCDAFMVDTKDARRSLVEASKAFDLKDFDKAESLIRAANDDLFKLIPARMNDEMKKARESLIDMKMRDVNISPLLTILKSATGLMKAGDYGEAIREMRGFKDMIKKAA